MLLNVIETLGHSVDIEVSFMGDAFLSSCLKSTANVAVMFDQ